MPPLEVSVVVPTHYRAESLRRTLSSLEAQNFPADAFEVIVVGNEGDPGEAVTMAAAARGVMDVRFTFVPDDPWQGRSPSLKRNHGVAAARAAWVAFTDDDCVASPEWLRGAQPFFANPRHGALEGRKIIPRIDPPTLTYKGLLLFTRPQGYQTANMFYRRSVFLEVGGFDTAFPFYLEDTDLAWSVLDRGFEIPFVEQAAIEHPVPPPEPMRLLAGAKRAILIPYLYRKHRARFRSTPKRALKRSHLPYLALYAALIPALAADATQLVKGLLIAWVVVLGLHAWRLFHACRVSIREVSLTTALLPVIPIVALVQLMRGNWRNRVFLWR